MPLAYDAHPAAGNALNRARAQHDVTATGPCCALHTMIPSFMGAVQPNSDVRFTQWRIFWLGLAVIRPGPDLNPATLLVAVRVGIARIGAALDLILLHPQMNLNACSPAVARRRVASMASTIFTDNPLPFLCMAADLENQRKCPHRPPPPSPGLGGAAPVGVLAPAHPV